MKFKSILKILFACDCCKLLECQQKGKVNIIYGGEKQNKTKKLAVTIFALKQEHVGLRFTSDWGRVGS